MIPAYARPTRDSPFYGRGSLAAVCATCGQPFNLAGDRCECGGERFYLKEEGRL